VQNQTARGSAVDNTIRRSGFLHAAPAFESARQLLPGLSSGARPPPSFFPSGISPRGWSAEQRNHQFTPQGRVVPQRRTLATQRSIAALPATVRSPQLRAGFPGTWASSPCPSPASTSQSGRNATRLDARSRPGVGLRGRHAGFRPLLRLPSVPRRRPRMSRVTREYSPWELSQDPR
jgi:hypothetical protein